MKKKTKTDDTTPKITRAGKSPKARARAVAPESIFDELRQMEDRIMRGAYDVFERNGKTHGRDLQDWLDAERALVWKPAIELREEDREFVVTIAVPGIDPRALDIQVTAAHLLIKAEGRHEHNRDDGNVHTCEFHPGDLFRSVTFPKKIDPSKVRTEFRNGLVVLRAPIADQTPTGRVKRRVS
jgi:HSP20 family protein